MGGGFVFRRAGSHAVLLERTAEGVISPVVAPPEQRLYAHSFVFAFNRIPGLANAAAGPLEVCFVNADQLARLRELAPTHGAPGLPPDAEVPVIIHSEAYRGG